MATPSLSPNQPLAPPPPGQVSDFLSPVNTGRYRSIVIALAILFPISTLSVLARIWTRALMVRRFGWDDVFAVLAMLLNIGVTICFVGEIQNGIADYDWNVRAIDWIQNNLSSYDYYNSVAAIIYSLLVGCMKISILILYLRVIGASHRKSRIGIYVLIAIMAISALACGLYILRFCSPVVKIFRPEVPGTCNVDTNLFYGQALIAVITDAFILVPPIPIIWNLSTTRTRKIGLYIVLCFGFIVTGIGIGRAVWFARLDSTWGYQLYNNYNGVFLSILEVNIGITTICLPALAVLFRRIPLPFIKGQNKGIVDIPPHGGEDDPAGDDVAPEPSTPLEDQAAKPQVPSPKRTVRWALPHFISDIPSRFGRSRPRGDVEKGKAHGVTVQKQSLGSIATQSMNSDQRRWVRTLPPAVPTQTFRGREFDD